MKDWAIGTIDENANRSGISPGDSSSEFRGPAGTLISQPIDLVFNVQRFTFSAGKVSVGPSLRAASISYLVRSELTQVGLHSP